MGSEGVELQTTRGFVLKILEGGQQCRVYKGKIPEVLKSTSGDGVMDQKLPNIAFIGQLLSVLGVVHEFFLVPNVRGKLQIEYRCEASGKVGHIGLPCASKADQFPVWRTHNSDVKDFMQEQSSGREFDFFVLGSDVKRIDMVTLKARYPSSRIVILRPVVEQEKKPVSRTSAEIAVEKSRATDINGDGADKKNPVFMARVFLRNLDLDKVRGLLVKQEMTGEEIGFVGTFLKMMVANKVENPDLMNAKKDLQALEELYRIGAYVALEDRDSFEKSLAEGLSQYVREALWELSTRKRDGAKSKLEELLYWEWQYRLKSRKTA